MIKQTEITKSDSLGSEFGNIYNLTTNKQYPVKSIVTVREGYRFQSC